MNKYSKELEIDEQKNLDDLAKIKKKIDAIKKSNETTNIKSKYSTDQLKTFLRGDLKKYFKVEKSDLLNKSIKELESDFNSAINNYLKSGKKLGDLGKLPDDAKEISRAIGVKKSEEFALANNYDVTTDALADIIRKRIADSNAKAKKLEDTFLKKGAPAPAPAPAPLPAPSPTPSPTVGNTIGEKIKNAYKVAKGSKILRYALIVGAGAGLFAYFSDGTKIKLDDSYSDDIKNLINPCLKPLLAMGGVIVPVADGAQLQVKKTGNAEDDSKGGVVYFPNGRAWTIDKSKKGTWSCADIVKEAIKPVTLKEAIRFRLKNLLNEEVDELQLAQDVDNMVDLLDMYSSADDLKNAIDLLTKYSTETINGKNAGKVFLEKYRSAGLGGFIGINSSVSDSVSKIIAMRGTTKVLKERLLNLVKNIESGKIVAKPSASGKANDSVTIKWDKDSVSDKSTSTSTSTSTSSSTQPKQQMTYTRCSGFPYEYGCKSEDIKDIQEKLGFDQRYITGNFGPVTKSKLIEKGYFINGNYKITQEIYNKIMNTGNESQPSSAQEKQTQTKIPYSEPSSFFQNNSVSRGFNNLNAKKDIIGTTSTDTTATEPKPQPINSNRDVIIKNLRERVINGDIVYRGNSLDQNDEEFLLNYINEKYGENGKFKFVVKRNTEKTLKGKDVIVFQRQRNKK
jgi:hypothetical protein